MLCHISGQPELLAEDPTIRESIRMREEMMRPVLVIQQYALATIRDLEEESGQDSRKRRTICEKMVIKSLAASVNAARNSV